MNSDDLLNGGLHLTFEARLSKDGAWPITALEPSVLQMNLGYACNQQCNHCHLNSGPARQETMSQDVMESALRFAGSAAIRKFDLTGGAPELNPHFRWLVETITAQGADVTDRCNLTVLTEETHAGLPTFLASNRVNIMASLPCYTSQTTDRIRGASVFDRSITGLQNLNAAGYGIPGSNLELTLVHNPEGPALPPLQESLEIDYCDRLLRDFGIFFTRLITIANMPIGRFLEQLLRQDSLKGYMHCLEGGFNSAALPNLMCRSTISVRWDGVLFDCDFNQALGIEIGNGEPMTLDNASIRELSGRTVKCQNHCYGCTAGNGSSCTGAVVSNTHIPGNSVEESMMSDT